MSDCWPLTLDVLVTGHGPPVLAPPVGGVSQQEHRVGVGEGPGKGQQRSHEPHSAGLVFPIL